MMNQKGQHFVADLHCESSKMKSGHIHHGPFLPSLRVIGSIAFLVAVVWYFSGNLLIAQTTHPAFPKRIFSDVESYPIEPNDVFDEEIADSKPISAEDAKTVISSASFVFAQSGFKRDEVSITISPDGECGFIYSDYADRDSGPRIWRETHIQLHKEAMDQIRLKITQSDCLKWPVYSSAFVFDGTQQTIRITTKDYSKLIYYSNHFPEGVTTLFQDIESIVLNPENSDEKSSVLIRNYRAIPDSVWEEIESIHRRNATTQPATRPTTQPESRGGALPSDPSPAISSVENTLKINDATRAALTEYESEGFLAIDNAKWSDQERKALSLTWDKFVSLNTIPTSRALARFKVQHANPLIVAMVWVELGTNGNPLEPTAGGSVFTVSFSNNLRDIKVLPGA